MERCPATWELLLNGVVLAACSLVVAVPACMLLVGMAAALVSIWFEVTLAVFAVVALSLAVYALMVCFCGSAALAQLCVGLCLIRGRLHGIEWARDATDFLRYYARGAVLIVLVPSLGAAIHAGVVGLVLLPPLVAYWLALRTLVRWLDALPDHPNWWAWYEATLPTVGPPIADRTHDVAMPY